MRSAPLPPCRSLLPPCRAFPRFLIAALCLASSGVSSRTAWAQIESAYEKTDATEAVAAGEAESSVAVDAPEAWREQSLLPLSEVQRAALQKTNEALATQIGKLNEKREWSQTEKLVETRWPQLLQEGVNRFFWILPAYLEALQKQGKDDEAATVMRQLSSFYLAKAGSWDGVWLSAWTADALEKAGDNQSALRWAKLNWMLCAHDEIQVRQAMQRVIRLRIAVGLERNDALTFLRFQTGVAARQLNPAATSSTRSDITKNPTTGKAEPVANAAKNVVAVSQNGVTAAPRTALPKASTNNRIFDPLALVKTPQFSPLALYYAQKNALLPQERITLFLVQGDFAKAIDEARSMGLDKPAGALEACRILRAASGNLHEANAWIRYAKGDAQNGAARDALSALQNRLQKTPPQKQPIANDATQNSTQQSATSSTRSADSASIDASSSAVLASGFLHGNEVQPIRLQATVLPVAVALMRANLITGEEAYERGALKLADIEEMVTAGDWRTGSWGMGDWGSIEGVPDVDLRREVMSVMWKHDARFQNLDAGNLKRIAPSVRLWVGDYLYKQNDEKCVPILNGILDEVKVPVKSESPLLFSAVERLAWFYRDRGEYSKAIDAWMRMEKVHADKGWYTGDAYLESGRLALAMGDKAKAQVLLAQVASRGVGVVNQISLIDQANLFISQGLYEKASEVLLPAVARSDNGQSQVALLSVLGTSYLEAGKFAEARKYFKEAVTAYKPQDDSGGATSVEMFVASAQQGLITADKWLKQEFDVPLRKIAATRDEQGVLHAKLYVHSFNKQAVKVGFADAATQLVGMTQQSQQRTDSLVTVTIYDVAFRSKKTTGVIEAKVFATTKPQTAIPIEFALEQDDE